MPAVTSAIKIPIYICSLAYLAISLWTIDPKHSMHSVVLLLRHKSQMFCQFLFCFTQPYGLMMIAVTLLNVSFMRLILPWFTPPLSGFRAAADIFIIVRAAEYVESQDLPKIQQGNVRACSVHCVLNDFDTCCDLLGHGTGGLVHPDTFKCPTSSQYWTRTSFSIILL